MTAQHTQLIPVFNGCIGDDVQPLVNARDLHKFLESKQQYSNWIQNQIETFEFTQGFDFVVINNFVNDETGFGGKRKIKEYHITLDMAKELSMVERNAKGKQARQYFIACEKQLHDGIAKAIPTDKPKMDASIDTAPNQLAAIKEYRSTAREMFATSNPALYRQHLAIALCGLNQLMGVSELNAEVLASVQQSPMGHLPEVAQFWDNYRVLDKIEKLNHAVRPEYIAINLPYFISACQRHGLPLVDGAVLKRALSRSEYLISCNVAMNSGILNKTVRVWLFKAEVVA